MLADSQRERRGPLPLDGPGISAECARAIRGIPGGGPGGKKAMLSEHSADAFNRLSVSVNDSSFVFSFVVQLPAFEDSISTLFAPIIISCSTMVDRLGDNYTSFVTETNHVYVLHQVTRAFQNKSNMNSPDMLIFTCVYLTFS